MPSFRTNALTAVHDYCAPHRFDDEDDRYQAGKALFSEAGDVANKEAAKRNIENCQTASKSSPSISGNQNDEHCSKPESDPDTKGEILPTEANAELINLKSNGHLLFFVFAFVNVPVSVHVFNLNQRLYKTLYQY